MGKIFSGILGPLSQSVGSVTGAPSFGRPVLRRKSNGGTNPRTAAQTAQRTRLQEASEYCRVNKAEILDYLGLTEVKGMTLWQQMVKWRMNGGSLPSAGPVWADISEGSQRIIYGDTWIAGEDSDGFYLSLEGFPLFSEGYVIESGSLCGFALAIDSDTGLSVTEGTFGESVPCLRGNDADWDFGIFLKSCPDDAVIRLMMSDGSAGAQPFAVEVQLPVANGNVQRDRSLWIEPADLVPAGDVLAYREVAGIKQDLEIVGSQYLESARTGVKLYPPAGNVTFTGLTSQGSSHYFGTASSLPADVYGGGVTLEDGAFVVANHIWVNRPSFADWKSVDALQVGYRFRCSGGILFGTRWLCIRQKQMAVASSSAVLGSNCLDEVYEATLMGDWSSYDSVDATDQFEIVIDSVEESVFLGRDAGAAAYSNMGYYISSFRAYDEYYSQFFSLDNSEFIVSGGKLKIDPSELNYARWGWLSDGDEVRIAFDLETIDPFTMIPITQHVTAVIYVSVV